MSRSTFRERSVIAWQKQVRDARAEPAPAGVLLRLADARVKPVTRRMASQVITKYEWLGTMAPTSNHYGLFFDSYCAGVTCVGFSAGANINAGAQFGLARDEVGYLARGANVSWAPIGANSKLIAWTARLVAADRRAARLLIAYADSDAGEIGTVYQAAGWAFVGMGSATRQWIAPNGRIFDQKYPWDMARRRGGTRRGWVAALKVNGWREQLSNPKGRYVKVLRRDDLALGERVATMSLPYPKRASEASSDAPAIHAGEGGAAPTLTLQQ